MGRPLLPKAVADLQVQVGRWETYQMRNDLLLHLTTDTADLARGQACLRRFLEERESALAESTMRNSCSRRSS